MAQQSVRLVLEAEDKTRAILDQFGRTVVDLGQKTEASMLRVETSMQRGARATRQLVVPLVSELVPALDNTVGRMASVVSGAALLGTGLTALGIAGAGLAGVLIGQLVSSLREAAKAKEDFNRAILSGDLQGVQAAIRKTSDEYRAMADAARDAARAGGLVPRFAPGGGAAGPRLPGQGDPNADLERERLRLAGQQRELERIQLGRALEESAADAARAGDVAAAEFRAIRERRRKEAEDAAREAVRQGALREGLLRGDVGGILPSEDPSIQRRLDEEAVRQGALREQLLRGDDLSLHPSERPGDRRAEQLRELIALEEERLANLQRIGPIVTQADAAQARLLEIQLERGRLLSQAQSDEERRLIDLRAEYERHIVLMDELRRTDPTVGMISGVKILVEEWTSLGRVMESLTLNIGQNVAQTLGRAMRGETKNIAQDFANALMRTITDSIAQYVTGNLFRGLLPGGAGIPLGSAPLNVTGAPSGALVGLQQSGYQLVSGAGGQTYAVPSTGLAYPAALPALSRTRQRVQELNPEMMPGDPAFSGIVLAPDLDESVNFAAEYGANAPTSRADVGASGYLGGAFSLAAFGLSAYSTYDTARRSGAQAGASAAGIATTGLTGAAAGAALGIGAGLGAAGGLVLAFVAIGLGGARAEAKKREKGRRADRTLAANQTMQELAAAINSLNNIGLDDGLATRTSSGNTAGGLLLALALATGNSELARFLDIRGITAEGFRHRAIALYGQGGVESIGELIFYAGPDNVSALLDSALQTLLAVQAADEGATFGFQEYDPRSAVSRTTYRPFTQLDTIAPSTQNLFASTAQMRRAGLDDTNIERQWRRVMANSTRRDIRFDLDEPSFDGVDL